MDKELVLRKLSQGLISKEQAKTLLQSPRVDSIKQAPFGSMSTEQAEDTDIAIIGVAGRYPCARNSDQLWQLIRDGKNAIRPIHSSRWDHSAFYHEDKQQLGKTNASHGGFLEDIESFDTLLFKISPRDAKVMDPQDRQFIEVTWELFEDAGYNRTKRKRMSNDIANVGVFVGTCFQQYHELIGDDQMRAENLVSSFGGLPGRVSNIFDLNGPSLAIDTACSSSMMAIHQSINALRNHECHLAIAGGVNVTINPLKLIGLKHLLGSGDRSMPFAESDGYVSSEGIGAVLLKPAPTALRDKDQIYGIIKSSAIGHSGAGEGYCIPNADEQSRLIRRVLSDAKLSAADIDYIEASAIGLELSDSSEFKALNGVFSDQRNIPIGTVKSNIGHCEASSTIAQLVKVLMQFKYSELPPSINIEKISPSIDFSSSNLSLNHHVRAWIGHRALINSTGAFGAYGCLVVEKAPVSNETASDSIPQAVVFSAMKPEQNHSFAQRLLTFIERYPDTRLRDIAFSLQTGRESLRQRVAFYVENLAELGEKLNHYLASAKTPELVTKHGASNSAQVLALIREWLDGNDVDWLPLHEGQDSRQISLPTYPFIYRRCWIDNEKQVNTQQQPSRVNTARHLDVDEPSTSLSRITKPNLNRNIQRDELPIVVIGAGPAGITAAKCLKDEGLEPLVLERTDRLGGIWAYRDNYMGGPYRSTRTQNSKYTFFFSDFPPQEDHALFSNVDQVNDYLQNYANSHDLSSCIHFDCDVLQVKKVGENWLVIYRHPSEGLVTVEAKGVLCCSGEFWTPNIPDLPGLNSFKGLFFSANAYHSSDLFTGKRVLVVGAGVSGSDIAADAAEQAKSCHWSVRGKGWFLPRMVGFVPNDCSVSFLGRISNRYMPMEDFKKNLKRIMPEYMAQYEKSSLLPGNTNNNIIHINERVVPYSAEGKIQVKPEPLEVDQHGVRFTDGSYEEFDIIIFATGYKKPQYEFLKPLEYASFYKNIFYVEDPSLAICNHPPGVAGFGAAFPYFELIARWYSGLMTGRYSLENRQQRIQWCYEHKSRKAGFFDTWIESIKIANEMNILPNPESEWKKYWQFINSPPIPSLFRLYGDLSWSGAEAFVEQVRKKFFVGNGSSSNHQLKNAILSSLSESSLRKMRDRLDISEQELTAALSHTGPVLKPCLEFTEGRLSEVLQA